MESRATPFVRYDAAYVRLVCGTAATILKFQQSRSNPLLIPIQKLATRKILSMIPFIRFDTTMTGGDGG